MTRSRMIWLALAALTAIVAAGCADPNYGRTYNSGYASTRIDYGVVEGVDFVPRQGGPSGVGAVVGGVAGGVLGHQIGGGTGNTVATIAGAIGGALAGNEVEKRSRREGEDYRVTVRMDDGSYRSVVMPDDPNLRAGDRVVVDNGRVYRR